MISPCSKLSWYGEYRDPKLSKLGREKAGGGGVWVSCPLTGLILLSVMNRLLVTTGLPGSYLHVWQVTEDSGE